MATLVTQDWLEHPASIKAIFVEAYFSYSASPATESAIYLSSAGYSIPGTAIEFKPLIGGNISLSESINKDNNISFSFGDIEIANINGELDSWLNTNQVIWTNRPITVYFGDPTWKASSLADFKDKFLKVFDGVISDIDSRNKNTVNIKVVDKLQRLNTPITENVLGTYGTWKGGQTNQETIKPLVFGEVFNFEPLLIDPSKLEYCFNDGDAERLIEIRDNGVPIYTPGQNLFTGANVSASVGTFKLNNSLAGTCTVSVQGVKKSVNFAGSGELLADTYTDNIAKIIAVIVTQYGKQERRLSFSDIDLTNFNEFATNNTQNVGVLVTDRTNILTVCQQLASSVGAQLYFNRVGKLQLLKYGVPTSDTPVTITDSDIILNSLSISNRLDIAPATKIAYCKNWYVQQDLLTGIPVEHKAFFAEEWMLAKTNNASVATTYKLSTDPEKIETLLLTTQHATNESQRRTTFYSTQRVTYKFTGTSKLLSLKLGQPVILKHNRFDLSNGVSGQVVSLNANWLNGTIGVEVLV